MTSARIWSIVAVMVLSVALAALVFRPLRDAGGFVVPGRGEALAAQAMFARALDNPAGFAGSDDAAPFGLAAHQAAEAGWRGLALAEAGGDCQGRGAYLLREGGGLVPAAITAPHRGADRWTGTIAAALFAEHRFAAAAWNTAPRRVSADCAGGDVTRERTHFLTSFSLAFAERYPAGRVIQLHGFDRSLRSSQAARDAAIILSDGSDSPGARLLDLADCLSRALHPLTVQVYPLDVPELGALVNRQGRALREAGFAGFTHVEMAADLRRRLAADRTLRDTFARCLLEPR